MRIVGRSYTALHAPPGFSLKLGGLILSTFAAQKKIHLFYKCFDLKLTFNPPGRRWALLA